MRTTDNRIQPHELIPAIVDQLPDILAEVGELLAEQQPDYAGFLAGDFEEILGASEGLITRLVGLTQRNPTTFAPQLASGIELALFKQIGRIHYQQRREINPLLAAYRTGTAVAWRHVSDTALRLGVPAEMFAELAAVVFTAVDQLSPASLRATPTPRRTPGRPASGCASSWPNCCCRTAATRRPSGPQRLRLGGHCPGGLRWS
jgi:hypothetical protein